MIDDELELFNEDSLKEYLDSVAKKEFDEIDFFNEAMLRADTLEHFLCGTEDEKKRNALSLGIHRHFMLNKYKNYIDLDRVDNMIEMHIVFRVFDGLGDVVHEKYEDRKLSYFKKELFFRSATCTSLFEVFGFPTVIVFQLWLMVRDAKVNDWDR